MTHKIEELHYVVWQVMYRLADMLDADDFNNIQAIVLAAGVPFPPLGYNGTSPISCTHPVGSYVCPTCGVHVTSESETDDAGI